MHSLLVMRFRNGIVASARKRVAPQNAPNGKKRPPPRPMLFDGFHGIRRTGWRVLARIRKQGRDRSLIKAKHSKKDSFHASFSIRPARSKTSRICCCICAKGTVRTSFRATKIRFVPRRMLAIIGVMQARRRRLARFLCTLFPTRLDTENPILTASSRFFAQTSENRCEPTDFPTR